MRKLPSRAVKVKKNDVSNENSITKNKIKKSTKNDDVKTNKKQTRQVLADKTNSGSDQSPSSISPIKSSISRPKRIHTLPAKLLNHDLTNTNKSRARIASTPLPTKVKNDKINIENTPIVANDKFKSPKKFFNTERSKRLGTSIKKVIETPKNDTASNKNNTKTNVPIYKKKSILNNSQDTTSNKLALYEFEFDPDTEPVKTKKKRIVRKNKPAKKKKVLSSSSSDDAMRKFFEDIKRIQAANLLKKLRLKKKMRDKELASERECQETENVQMPDHNDSPPGSPQPLDEHMESSPPSPILCSNKKKTNASQNIEINPNISANASNKPCSSPWRMELKTDKKWSYNFSVKASMTPAYERDTVHVLGLDDQDTRPKKYGNMLELFTSTPVTQETTNKPERNLKQASILSFYEKSLNKSPRKKSSKSPKKKMNESSFENDFIPLEEINNITDETPSKVIETLAVSNCFGFDDNSVEFDQENVSPTKIKKVEKLKNILKSKNHVKRVLRENNQIQKGPTPITPSVVRNIVEANKIVEDPPEETPIITQINPSSDSDNSENVTVDTVEKDVALFEDLEEIELVHSIKPNRKSYVARKRPVVRFKEVEEYVNDEASSNDESMDDDFAIEKYVAKKKKIKRKPAPKQLSKKEEKEAEKWAAGFNSLLEEAEDYELCIE